MDSQSILCIHILPRVYLVEPCFLSSISAIPLLGELGPQEQNGRPKTVHSFYSNILPSTEMVTTCQGINFPLSRRAFSAAICRPPQQGTSIRAMVTLLILF